MDTDGTQAPQPPQTFTDPLAGLAGSDKSDPGMFGSGRDDFTDIKIAEPVEPDPDVVRNMVDAALADEEKAKEAPAARAEGPARPSEPSNPPPAAPPRSWRAPGQLLPQMLRPRRRGQERQVPEPTGPALRKPSNGSAGVALALVLLLVFVIIAIQFVASFFESVSGIFQ
ncbi:hypothetical protein [Qaidamihabitans albus]|uniref:hypothetical protein n=1 Tax=Qaidamihabitans albus TaxID=2795733 RepID=UPI0018F24B5E|nr:hypothetical protein [Qaidamihabitans albus]